MIKEDKEKKKITLILYGAGKRGRTLAELLTKVNADVKAFFDSDDNKVGAFVEGIQVLSVDCLSSYKDLQWCITVGYPSEVKRIREKLISCGFDPEAELKYGALLAHGCNNNPEIDELVNGTTIACNSNKHMLFDCLSGVVLGGIEARTIILCSELKKHGNDDVYIVSDAKGHSIDIPEIMEPYIIRTSYGSEGKTAVDIVTDCIRILLDNLPCVINTNQPNLLLMAAYIVRAKYPDSIKIISTIAGLSEQIIDDYMSFGTFSDYYVCVSNDIKNRIVGEGISPERAEVIYAPFYCDQVLKRDYSTEDIPIKIGYAGRLDGFKLSQKRLDLLLKLLESLEKKEINYHITIAGDGPAKKEFENQIELMGLKHRVTMLGYVEKAEISDFWKEQDVAVNMADYEGRSISVVEAMGAGAVPVVTDTSGVNDDIRDGENGFIVPLRDYKGASSKIEFLYHNRDLLPIIGKKAHDEVWPKSRISKYVDRWEQLLEEF